MSEMTPQDIIRRPYITERTSEQIASGSRYAFVVNPRANKIQIRWAIEQIYKVKVRSVNIINHSGKKKRIGWKIGRTPSWKKAIITLVPPGTIDIFEGV